MRFVSRSPDWELLYLSGLSFFDIILYRGVQKIQQINGAFAIVYHKRAYKKILELFETRIHSADDALAFLTEKYIVYPFLVTITNDWLSNTYRDTQEVYDLHKRLVDRYFLGV